MEFIISEDQTGFMSKRRMAVNVRKLLDVMDISNIEKIPALILSLDYKKAFDLAEVDAVLKSLEYFKFAPYLVKWTRILYTNFTVRIQNNGYFSEKIDVQRSVHQGGCASAFLFNILVETMAIELRKHEDIRPLTVNGVKQLLNQYADDADVSSEFEQKSLDAIIDVLDDFQMHSGLTVNYDKTSIYRIGSMKSSNARLYTTKPLAWTNEGITVLGTRITHKDITKINYDPIMDKISSTLSKWSSRDISLIGKVKIINTLIASLFVHQMTVLPNLPETYVVKAEQLFNNFIWRGARAKIKLSTLQMELEHGGLRLVNLRIKEAAIKITWIQILRADTKCANISYSLFSSVLREDIFRCNLHKDHVKFVVDQKSSKFWFNMLSAWCDYNYAWQNSPDSQFIWWNSNILIAGKPFCYIRYYKRGLKWVSQLFEEGECLSARVAFERFGLTIMDYNSILSAVPNVWRQTLKNQPTIDRCTTNYDQDVVKE